jgi:hypothetical protein
VLEDAARARATEANLLEANGHLCCAVYLSGYVVECKLKSLLNKMGKPFPASGRAGHNLRGLWQAAGLRYGDLSGYRRAFLDIWATDLRYRAKLPEGHTPELLLKGARELAGLVTIRIRNTRGPRGGKRV